MQPPDVTTGPELSRPRPDVDDPLYRRYFEGLTAGKIVVPTCADCSALVWPPRPYCRYCQAPATGESELSREGVVHTFVVSHRGFHPAFADLGTYVTLLVELPEGPRMYGNLVSSSDEVFLGQRVRAHFSRLHDGVVVLDWEPILDPTS